MPLRAIDLRQPTRKLRRARSAIDFLGKSDTHLSDG
jgi:hypothetical protein